MSSAKATIATEHTHTALPDARPLLLNGGVFSVRGFCVAKSFQGERLRPEGIVSELLWLEALTDETSLVPQRPVRTKDGALVTTATSEQGNITCSLLHWIEANPLVSGEPLHRKLFAS